MKSILPVALRAATVAVLIGCVAEPVGQSAGRRRPPGQAETPRTPPQEVVPPGPGKYVAFDVLTRDHRLTIRYVLEITHPSGEVTTVDLGRPRLVQRRTVIVPLPQLPPGEYKIVIIAESRGGPARSSPIVHQIKDR